MHWVGVPIMMTSNSIHKYLKQTTYLKNSLMYQSDKERAECEELEGHRKAFMNRINFVKLNEEHDGVE